MILQYIFSVYYSMPDKSETLVKIIEKGISDAQIIRKSNIVKCIKTVIVNLSSIL